MTLCSVAILYNLGASFFTEVVMGACAEERQPQSSYTQASFKQASFTHQNWSNGINKHCHVMDSSYIPVGFSDHTIIL